MLSVSPVDYSLTMFKKNIHVKIENMKEKISPSINENRLGCQKDNLEKFKVEYSNYIDLIMFPKASKHTYKSAKQIIEENIELISSDEFDIEKDINTEEQSQLSHIRNIVSKKSHKKKQRRQYKFNNIAFQKTAVNSVLNYKKKT